ncbi:MAG: ABC transporter permease subunit [Bdellovibrionia bacterium]
MRLSQIIGGLLIAFLLIPFVIIISRIPLGLNLDYREALWATINTLSQGFFAAIFSVLGGVLISLALLHFRFAQNKFLHPIFSGLALLPSLLPTLFIVMNLFFLFSPFPFGIIGITFAHAVIYAGIIAVALEKVILARYSGLSEVSEVLGASRYSFWLKGVLPGLARDLVYFFMIVFSSAATSFSIPLVLGGSSGTNLEVLIYEKIRIHLDWSTASGVAILQTVVFYFGFYLLSLRKRHNEILKKPNTAARTYFYFPLFGVVFAAFYFFFILGFIKAGIESFNLVDPSILQQIPWSKLISGSILISIFSVILIATYFLLSLSILDNQNYRRILSGMVSPSAALAGFSFLLIGGSEGVSPFIQVPLVLVILFVPVFHKIFWESHFSQLEKQVEVARVLGASRTLILHKILLPQSWDIIFKTGSLMFFWSMSDFAVSRILSSREITLGMAVDNLMSGYRLHYGFVVLMVLLMISLVAVVIMRSLRSVFSHRDS